MRCLEKAESIQVESLSITNPDINWNMWAGSLLTPVDVKTICFYISKEVRYIEINYFVIHSIVVFIVVVVVVVVVRFSFLNQLIWLMPSY